MEKTTEETIFSNYADTYDRLEGLYEKNPTYMYRDLVSYTNEYLRGFRKYVSEEAGENIGPVVEEIFNIIEDILQKRGDKSLETKSEETIYEKFNNEYHNLENIYSQKPRLFKKRPTIYSELSACSDEFLIEFRSYIVEAIGDNEPEILEELFETIGYILYERSNSQERSGR